MVSIADRTTAIALASLLLIVVGTGCAWRSKALNLGDGTYQVTANAAPARGGEAGARRMALVDANRHCESEGKTLDVVDVEVHSVPPFGNGVATVTFRCDEATR